MSLMSMKKNAKWIIFPFGVLILLGLILMDWSGAGGGFQPRDYVGRVNGQEIPLQNFQRELQTRQQMEEARMGRSPSALQLAQIRENLFESRVQFILLQDAVERYELHASVEEMRDYLLDNPEQVAQMVANYQYRGYEQMPAFLADSVIDESRYRGWLAQDSVYDRPSMRDLESQLKGSIIPQLQLQLLVQAQYHHTALEEAHQLAQEEEKARLRFYRVALDSVNLPKDSVAEDRLRAYFDARPDSFHYESAAARLGYVRIPIEPSARDSALMLEFTRDLKERAQDGEPFAELATSYSNDPGSAENGGKLGGFQPRSAWVPAFSEAAFALEPGQISDPVLTRFGYHLILLHDKKTEDSVELADVSHILVDLQPGLETVDSLLGKAEEIRVRARESGLAQAVEDLPWKYEKSGIFTEDDLSPLGGDYVQGVRSFAFSRFEAKETVSDPLQNENAIFILEKLEKYPRGRSFERAKAEIRERILQEMKLELAREELKKRRSQIVAAAGSLPAKMGPAVLDSTGLITAESWVPGFGYAHPALHRVFNQPEGEWGPVLTTDQAAIMAMVVEKQSPSRDDLLARAKESMRDDAGRTTQLTALFQRWMEELKNEADIENRLDDMFRS